MSKTLFSHRSRKALPALAAMAIGATIVVLPVSGAAAATSDGLVGSWRMDEASGSAVTDSAGSNNGTYTGSVARMTGKLGSGALDFTNGRVTIPDAADLDLAGPMTVAAWVRPDVINTSSIVKKAVQGTTGGYELGLSNNGTAFFRLNQPSGLNTFRVDSGTGVTALVPGQWVHLAGVYNGTTMTLHVNGAARPGVAGPAAIDTNNLPLAIGSQSDGTSPMDGAVDSVHLYDRALSAAEITELMSADPAQANVAVTPAAVTFVDQAGTANDSYTIPATTGVEYMVGGAVKAAGRYAGTGTVTVTARATAGFVLAGGATATWTKTFATDGTSGPVNPGPTEQRYGFFLNDAWSTRANHVFQYGRFADQVFTGDWDGDGTDTIALRRGNVFYVKNALGGGQSDATVVYGRPGDTVLVGDWDGDGKDTFAVRRGAQYHVRNSMTSGPAHQVVVYGRSGDQVLVGDWNGDTKDTFAVRRGAQYYVKDTIAAGNADKVVVYGRAGDRVLVGNWDGADGDTFAVRRGAEYHIKNSIAAGKADLVLIYGRADDEIYVGDWDGDGSDTLGVRRVP
jgi:hypothetical protein